MPPQPPSADEPTEVETARYILARSREMMRLTDYLDSPEIVRLLREIIDRTQAFLDAHDRKET